MLEFDYRNVETKRVGEKNGLDLSLEFNNYKNQIVKIIANLNAQKDKPGQWLRWMNLGYNEETIWYVKEYASQVKGQFENILILFCYLIYIYIAHF